MSTAVSNDLLLKYDHPGPRYTSYPTAPVWSDSFGHADHAESLRRAGQVNKPVSIYVHLPFCRSMCWYCGCNVSITQNLNKISRYVDRVIEEAALVKGLMGTERPVVQHHWGGGTPTHLPPEEMERLFVGLNEIFPVRGDAEISIEADPRVTTIAHLEALRRCGFNRISMGVQDFNPDVQNAIHRVQSFEETRVLADAANSLGFKSLNFDLVYGLPLQTLEGFGKTLDHVLEMGADRIACYCYAHVPWIKKHQKVINTEDLPQGRAKMDLYLKAYETLLAADYVAVGMDHFAKKGDSLLNAVESGQLHRNFMGYTTMPAEDMISFGVTSISEVAGSFAQNCRSLPDWHRSIAAGELPVERGHRRNEDDDLRRRIILDLMCKFALSYADYGGRDRFIECYGEALDSLEELASDGLLQLDHSGIRVSELGRLFLRNICMPFDAYLSEQMRKGQPIFSKTV
ncbi:MAG: oxygen-independent coproporphyrinogen III oxidase [Planctomycetota bacterium]|jgi:oxygen-independent coproporphyrinogen-3 oxidase